MPPRLVAHNYIMDGLFGIICAAYGKVSGQNIVVDNSNPEQKRSTNSGQSSSIAASLTLVRVFKPALTAFSSTQRSTRQSSNDAGNSTPSNLRRLDANFLWCWGDGSLTSLMLFMLVLGVVLMMLLQFLFDPRKKSPILASLSESSKNVKECCCFFGRCLSLHTALEQALAVVGLLLKGFASEMTKILLSLTAAALTILQFFGLKLLPVVVLLLLILVSKLLWSRLWIRTLRLISSNDESSGLIPQLSRCAKRRNPPWGSGSWWFLSPLQSLLIGLASSSDWFGQGITSDW